MKTKLKIILLAGLLPIIHLRSTAQDQAAMDKIESARIALITERLGLTPDQAQKFWPIYNEFIQKRRDISQALVRERQGLDMNKLSDEQSRRLNDMMLDAKQRQLDLEKTYSLRLQQVISAQQVIALRRAEEDFRRMIIERLQQRKMQQNRREQMMQKRGN